MNWLAALLTDTPFRSSVPSASKRPPLRVSVRPTRVAPLTVRLPPLIVSDSSDESEPTVHVPVLIVTVGVTPTRSIRTVCVAEFGAAPSDQLLPTDQLPSTLLTHSLMPVSALPLPRT